MHPTARPEREELSYLICKYLQSYSTHIQTFKSLIKWFKSLLWNNRIAEFVLGLKFKFVVQDCQTLISQIQYCIEPGWNF